MNQLVPITFTPGLQIYKYQLISKIGQGSFGEVWLANDAALQREFAIKLLKPGFTVDERLREGRIGNLVEHNNLVRVHQADVVNHQSADIVILAMDYHASGSVEKLANPAGYLPLPLVLQIARDILQGLDHLHAQSLFHNDIKPGNILVGDQQQAMLTDYGITGISSNGAPATAPNTYRLHGAPEVRATGNVGVSSDIFQVGMTLARLLLGLTHLRSILNSVGPVNYESQIDTGCLLQAADFPRHIPATLRRIILKAIHPNPSQRYASSLEMRRAVEKLSFPGFWTVDATGSELGEDSAHQYRYSTVPTHAGKFDVTCERLRKASGKSQRVSKFCGKSLTRSEADKLLNSFKKFVVVGK